MSGLYRPGQRHRRDVARRVNAARGLGRLRLQGPRIRRYPAGRVDEAGIAHHSRCFVRRHGDQEVEAHLGTVLEHDAPRRGVDAQRFLLRMERDRALGKLRLDVAAHFRAGGRHRRAFHRVDRDPRFTGHAATFESMVQEHRRFVRRGRALERRLRNEDREVAAREALEHGPQPLRAGHGVERVPTLGEPRNARFAQVGAERDYEVIPRERFPARRDLSAREVDRHEVGLQEGHAGVEQCGTRLRDLLERALAEHDPGLPRSDIEAGRSVYNDDRVVLRRQPAKRVRGGDSAEAAAEDDRGLRAHLVSLRACAARP